MASRVLFILQAGYFKAKTLFFSFEIDEVADDVKHVLQQHYPQYHDTGVEIGDRQTDPLRATAQTTDSPQFQRNIQRALNRGESYHKLVRAVAYANGGKLRVRTDQEQQLWSECSRLLTNCIIYYNACILSELLERAERRQDYQPTDAIKRANPASWKHVNLYGPTASWILAMGLTSRNWSISWRRPAVGTPRRRTEVAIF